MCAQIYNCLSVVATICYVTATAFVVVAGVSANNWCAQNWVRACIHCKFYVVGVQMVLETCLVVDVPRWVGVAGVVLNFFVVVTKADDEIVACGDGVFQGCVVGLLQETLTTATGQSQVDYRCIFV